jgi:hypothetical protein
MLKKRVGCSIAIGIAWVVSGVCLLPYGLNFVLTFLEREYIAGSSYLFSIVDIIAPFVGGVEYGAIILMVFCILFGRFSARYFLEERICNTVEKLVYSMSFVDVLSHFFKVFIIFAVFAGIGFLGKERVGYDVLAALEITTGSAAIYIGFSYFRNTMFVKTPVTIYDRKNPY